MAKCFLLFFRVYLLQSDLQALTNEDILSIEKVNENLTPLYDFVLRKNLRPVGETPRELGRAAGYGAPAGIYKKVIQQRSEDEKNIEEVIDAQNTISELEAMQSIPGVNVTSILNDAKSVMEGARSMAQVRVRAYLNVALRDWENSAYRFLDGILRDSNMLDLPQFDEVRELIKKNRGSDTAGDCYPDFPMKEVLSLIQGDANLSTYLNDGLFAAWEEMGLGLKNVGVSALLNPDFYFFNPSTDVIDEIFPHHVIDKAKDSIIASREAMKPAEKDWFKGAYREHLGQKKSENILDLVQSAFSSDLFKGDDSPLKSEGDKIRRHIDEYGTIPDGLQGSVASSIYQANQMDDDRSITVKSIEYSKKPEEVGARSDKDIYAVYLNERSERTLLPSENSEVCKHRFGTREALSYLPESAYRGEPVKFDPDKDPEFIPPTESGARRITSKFGKRTLNGVFGGKRYDNVIDIHDGIDIAGDKSADSLGSPIYAAETGKITDVIKKKNGGIRINIQHGNGYQTRYGHLQWDSIAQGLHEVFHGSFSQSSKDRILTVSRGTQIGTMGNTGFSSGPHLHFEIRLNGEPDDPLNYFNTDETGKYIIGSGEYKSQGPILGIDPENESLLLKSVQQFEKDLKNGMGYGMMRAYPTFKLYFIESDLGERKRYAFDDFFSYNAVQEIQIVRHRKIAADLCVIQLTNISGSLSNREFFDAENPNLARDSKGEVAEESETDTGAVNTIKENPIASLMLQSGTQVQLRLGYHNNPEELETVFNGIIVDHEFSDSTDLVTIICQSFAIELVQTIQGKAKSMGGWFSDDGRTWQVLNDVLSAPEVVHFGRWESGGFGATKQRGLLQNRWTYVPRPRDDNLFPPQGTGPLSIVDLLLTPWKGVKGSKKYVMYNTTIWDVLQEMTLRHPSYIASAVPYEGEYGPRMTLFFGVPDQFYFARDATLTENRVIDKLRDIIKEGATDDYSQRAREMLQDAAHELGDKEARQITNAEKKVEASQSDEEIEIWLKKTAKLFAQARGFIKPFRSYHVATSSLHIMHNSIASSGHNTFNTVTLQYSDDEAEADEETRQLNFDDPETFTLKADAGIPDEHIREMFASYPNCVGPEMAKLYGVSLLYNSLKEAYGGSLILVGNPRIKPYDIVYLFDEYNDMYGPVEVEKVVHKFSQKNGFITEITPDLCVHVNQESTLSTQDAMGIIAEHGLRQINMEPLGTIAKAVGTANDAMSPISTFGFSPIARMFYNGNENAVSYNQDTSLFGSIGVFIFRKLITRTQLAHPFRFSPLVLSGKPMIGGLPNRYTDGSFIQAVGNWFKETSETIPLFLEDTYDKFKTNYWPGHSQGDFKTVFFGDDRE
jgi:murein DD-endopeptidase MepM/ murein hydrolase activator NlpD